jgi:sulfite exporter TauE/SafE/plastocyanin domain-containing protein/copper chaperone CopZ
MNTHLKKITIPIRGMHCKSCELIVEKNVAQVAHVKKVAVNHHQGQAQIYYDQKPPKETELAKAIETAGYKIGEPDVKHFFSRNSKDYKDLGVAFLFVMGAYWVLKGLGLTNLGVNTGPNPAGFGVVLMVGLVAGFSTCMALVGGLVLGLATKHAEMHPEASTGQKFKPHLYFNFGRVGGYAILGGILGTAGSVFQLSSTMTGILTIIVALVMLLVGLQLTDISPRINSWKFTLPKSIAKLFGANRHEKEYSHKNSIIMGALTFFLPCGFTQAMQLYAVSTGSFTKGALIMGLFALGTAPGLLSIGGLTSIIKGGAARRFFKVAGVTVVLLALFNLSNGLALAGWNLDPVATPINTVKDPNVKLVNGVQVIKMTETARGYNPNQFTVTQGVPVRWIIDAQAPYSCATSLVVPKLKIQKNLQAGENIIEFTPKEVGKIPFSCSMGMYTGVLYVTDGKTSAVDAQDNSRAFASAAQANTGSCGGGGGGCGGCGGGKTFVPNTVPTEAAANIATDEQVIKTTYTQAGDIQPNTFTVKAGRPVRLEIDVQDNGSGCMSTIMVPGLYNTPEYLQTGKKIVMNFTPDAGSYQITCAMGVPRGTIIAQ